MEFAQEINSKLFEVSAKNNIGINELFNNIAL
jgi:hypothetical protein